MTQLIDRSAAGTIGMTGNVSEWTRTWADAYADARYPQLWPGSGAATDLIVVRGGNAQSDLVEAQATHRHRVAPGSPSPQVGFRCQYGAP